jgi:hypothetical protein
MRRTTSARKDVAMPKQSLNANGVTFAIILGLLFGPILFYALAGSFTASVGNHTYAIFTLNRGLAGGVAGVLGVLALVNAERFRNAGLAGAITGIAAGVGELVVAVVPWWAFSYTHPTCDANGVCPLSSGDLARLALTTGGFALVLFTLGLYSLATLVNAVRVRVNQS